MYVLNKKQKTKVPQEILYKILSNKRHEPK